MYSVTSLQDNGNCFTVILHENKDNCTKVEVEVKKITGKILDKRKDDDKCI
jgi:hypothetical protein